MHTCSIDGLPVWCFLAAVVVVILATLPLIVNVLNTHTFTFHHHHRRLSILSPSFRESDAERLSPQSVDLLLNCQFFKSFIHLQLVVHHFFPGLSSFLAFFVSFNDLSRARAFEMPPHTHSLEPESICFENGVYQRKRSCYDI